jgi:hypothetical protein
MESLWRAPKEFQVDDGFWAEMASRTNHDSKQAVEEEDEQRKKVSKLNNEAKAIK